MKKNILVSIFGLSLLAILLLSNVGGRAGSTNWGNTGAPGDQMIGNNPRTCQSCHATGDIQVTMDLEILDEENQPVTTYIPNKIYTAKVLISAAAGTMPAGYGFQMVSLFDADTSDVNGWTDSGHSENVQIESSSNTNRVYAEHNGRSSNSEFLVQWQAPEPGKGNISFYAAGNGVDGNGSSSGDGAATPQKVTLTENLISSVAKLEDIGIRYELSPNPIKHQLYLNFESTKNVAVEIKLINMNGQIFYKNDKQINIGNTLQSIDVAQLASGIYLIQIVGENSLSTKIFFKL